MHELTDLIIKPEFPRSGQYDETWVLDNQMGPNALWLAEWLCESLTISPGMRILDLGCGRAMTSIFLAREFSAHVWAADLWVDPDQNWERIVAADLGERVCPLRMEAHALPFAKGYFDAIISIDSYHYFGTDVLYLNYISDFIKPGGMIGIVVPGLMQPLPDEIPAHLAAPQSNGTSFWEEDCASFKTADWWQDHWRWSSATSDVRADIMPDGWRHWRDFESALELSGKNIFPSCAEALEQDQGDYIGFIRLTARRTAQETLNLYNFTL